MENSSYCSKRSIFDGILSAITNGQRQQALQQSARLDGSTITEMLDYFTHELNRPEDALEFCKVYFQELDACWRY